MEHIPQSKTREYNNGAAVSWEYDMQNASLNVAPITIKGRYPESGFTSNLESDAIVHIVEGVGIVGLSDGSSIELAKNDQIHIAVGDAYYFQGDLNIVYAASPAWTPQQTRHIN